jgi:AcrR family transcriptional regulator
MVNLRVEKGNATRRRIVEVATSTFAEHGYDGTSIEAVLEDAGISRGSLYHHFAGKEALFEAVVQAVEERVAADLVAAVESTRAADLGTAEAIRAGCLAWISLAGDPVVQRVVLSDAIAVLGWDRWRQIEERYCLGLLRVGMQAAADGGLLDADLAELFAHTVLAALNELALFVARADDRAAAGKLAERAVDELLAGLRRRPTAHRRR